MAILTKQPKTVAADTYAFREWLKTIPTGDYRGTIERIKSECMINDSRIHNIKAGVTRIKPLEFQKINAIAGFDILAKFKAPKGL